MKELVDILSVYLALAMGGLVFWLGLLRDYPLESCLLRALVAMAAVYVTGLAARFLMALFLAFGGRKDSGEREEGARASRRTEDVGEVGEEG